MDKKTILRWTLQNIVWIWLLVLVLCFGVFNQYFLSMSNLQNILVQASVLGTIALAMSLPLMVAEIDLSIPANVGFSAALGAVLAGKLGLPMLLAAPIGMLVATFIGFFNALCITRLKMVSLIQTLSMMIFLQGALLALTRGRTITELGAAYMWLGQANVASWPLMPLVFATGVASMYFLLRHMVLGRSILAVGSNAHAAHAAGIRVGRVKIRAYALAGFLAGVAGFLLASWQMAITSAQGSSYLLYAIAAPIIGGVSVFGGRGSALGILGGVLLLTVIQVGLSIVDIPSFYVNMIGGLMIFLAVAIDAVRVRHFG